MKKDKIFKSYILITHVNILITHMNILITLLRPKNLQVSDIKFYFLSRLNG